MYLFFDTETTGIPKNYQAPLSNLSNWPRLVQLAWILTDKTGAEHKSSEYIIKPHKFSIPHDAARIHGITTDIARQVGLNLKQVLDEIIIDISKAVVLIAHNMQFDERIVGAEFLRLGYQNYFENKNKKCTMQSSTNLCRIPGPYGYKWPKLQELHQKLFKKQYDNAHRALDDVRACAKCYFELRRRGIMA
ncbi:MAG: 3'-5' exonuclease [Syntrophales bacterium]|nr:3'-5' exonuclease [Syntrophales bacterium]